MPNLIGQSTTATVAAVKGENTSNERAITGGGGVLGISNAGCGVEGISTSGRGVVARSDTDYALRAHSRTLSGVRASSDTGVGVEGESRAAAPGVVGSSVSGNGVEGRANAGTGVLGTSSGGVGVKGFSETFEGMHAETKSLQTAAIAAYNLNPLGTGAAIFAKKVGGQGHAGFFDGDVWIGGVLGVGKDIILANADCAEDFDIADADSIEPGTVMVLGEDESLHQSSQPYDKRVAGVVSGAGKYKPGIVLDKQEANSNRKPIALLGKVYCKVDAQYASIEVGDLLTTSPSPGHAMKASDHLKAFGAVIGKALRPLKDGQGLIPILIALQ